MPLPTWEERDMATVASNLILDIYRNVDGMSPEAIKPAIFEDLARTLHFDSALWTRGRVHEGVPAVEAVYLHNLPMTMLSDYGSWASDDFLFEAVMASPGKCYRLYDLVAEDRHKSSDLYQCYMKKYDINDALGVMMPTKFSNVQTYISLYRGARSEKYSEAECKLLTLVIPHMLLAEDMVKIPAIRHEYRIRPEDGAVGVVSEKGEIAFCEGSFITCLDSGWPAWKAPLVPSELRCLLDFKKPKVETCGAFRILLEPSEFGMVLAIRLLKLIDKLTPRQQEIAHMIRQGKSYKVIARLLGTSPFTVTNHVNAIYTRFGALDRADFLEKFDAPINHPGGAMPTGDLAQEEPPVSHPV